MEDLLAHARVKCPFCEQQGHNTKKKNLALYEDGSYRCYRCRTKGSDHKKLEKLFQTAIFTPPKPRDTFPVFTPLFRHEKYIGYWNYLRKRGFTRRHIGDSGVGVLSTRRFYVSFPIRWHKVLLGFFSRGITSREFPQHYLDPDVDREKIVYNMDAVMLHDKPVFIVESVMDAVINGLDRTVATLGKELCDPQFRLMCKWFIGREVIVAFDGDAYDDVDALTGRFRMNGINAFPAYLPPCEDACSINGKLERFIRKEKK